MVDQELPYPPTAGNRIRTLNLALRLAQRHRIIFLAHRNDEADQAVRFLGEHGIGVEKIDFMPRLFTPEDLDTMLRLRSAFNPDNRCSPRKMLPTAGACIEPSKAGRRAAL